MPDSNLCGECRLCCKLYAVPDVSPIVGAWCQHTCEAGCAIYDSRPAVCAEYECMWLAAQKDTVSKTVFTDGLRPDRCGVIMDMTGDGQGIVARSDLHRKAALQGGKVRAVLDRFAASGKMVILVAGSWRQVLTNSPRAAAALESIASRLGRQVL